MAPLLAGCRGPAVAPEELPASGDPEIAAILRQAAAEHRLVGMGAALIEAGGRIELAVVGWRKAGDEAPIELDDLWHIGSCTKSMTATLMGRLVEEGRLEWETTLAEIFPELATELASEPGPGVGGVTVAQLLSHLSGLPRDPRYGRLGDGSPSEQRLEALRQAGEEGLERDPGTQAAYSNLGYIITGAAIERLTGQSFEEAIRERLFAPLGLDTALFECERPPGEGRVLWSHRGNGRPVAERKFCRNDAPVLRPAGCVRSSLEEWARFIRVHMDGARGESGYLAAETFAELHRDQGGGYGLGWEVIERDWAGGDSISHRGSNLWNYSNVWIAPREGFALLVCTNQGDSFEATDEVAGRLIELVQSRR
jgi:CubicO group peptidase (beta-lactamase class C family)